MLRYVNDKRRERSGKRMIYFDNAATTLMKPDTVARAVYDAILTMGNAARGAHDASL